MENCEYKAMYQFCEVDEKFGPKPDVTEFKTKGYDTIESLKADFDTIVNKLISEKKLKKGRAMVDIQIIEETNGREVYIDNDSVEFTIKGGKMVAVEM